MCGVVLCCIASNLFFVIDCNFCSGVDVADVLVQLLSTIKQVEHLKYVLVLIDELFEGNARDISCFKPRFLKITL
jgi:hypothetical protein